VKTWRTLARKHVVDFGKWLTVENHTIQLHDGRVIEDWPYIITPDYINVMVETEEGKFLCFRQTKYAIEGTSLAPIGGYLEAGEEPLACAQREVLEETGYQAREWISLGSYIVDPNRGPMVGNLFLARGAYRVQERDADDLEEQELLMLTRTEVELALEHGEFKVLAWQANVALGLMYLQKQTLRRLPILCKVESRLKEDTMPEFKRFPKTRVAFVTEVGPFDQAIPRGFEKLFAWLGANNLQPMGQSFGVYHDDPATVPAEKLRSELCVPVAPDVQGSGEVQVKEIAGFEAATIVYQGDANITPAYNEVYDWLRAQGYRDAGAPIEVYLSMPGEELRAEVYVPIVKAKPKPARKAVAKKPIKQVSKKPAKRTAKKPVKKK
jgi:DNA gyrase inhibitor GyrI/8-oxo-dGTP pyrophosphatase MutT (NUDIX family)